LANVLAAARQLNCEARAFRELGGFSRELFVAEEIELKEADQGEVRTLWVPVRTSAYKKTAFRDYQGVLDPEKARITTAD
jgi:hypothetical protein